MMFESVCMQCKNRMCWIASFGNEGNPDTRKTDCAEGSPNFLSQDGCWQFTHKDDEEREDE